MRVKLSSYMPNTRALALMALLEIWQRGGKPKTALEDVMVPLDKRDRAFLMELVYGVVRYRDTLDWILNRFLKKPSGLGPWTWNNLRTGTYQILFMRVPKWAAINEAVKRRDEFTASVKQVINAHATLAPALKMWPPLWDLLSEDVKNKHREVTERSAKATAETVGVDLNRLTALASLSKMGGV